MGTSEIADKVASLIADIGDDGKTLALDIGGAAITRRGMGQRTVPLPLIQTRSARINGHAMGGNISGTIRLRCRALRAIEI